MKPASVAPPDDVGNDASHARARRCRAPPIAGSIEYEGDVDWYRLSARTGQRYHITLDRRGQSGDALGDPLLRVLERDGTELAINDDAAKA